MNEILIKFVRKSMMLPKNALDIKDLTLIFNVKEAGLHLKVNDGVTWINVWPQSNGCISEESLPPHCTEALLIAMENDNPTQTSTIVTNSNIMAGEEIVPTMVPELFKTLIKENLRFLNPHQYHYEKGHH